MAGGHDLFFNLILVFGSATIVATLFHLMRLPPMVGFLAAGVLVGPNGLKLVSSLGEVETLAEIASVLLLFTLGLEFSWGTVLSLRKLLVNLGLGQVLLTAAVFGGLANVIFDLGTSPAWFIGILIAMSSTAAVLKLLHDERHMETPFGQASMGILISQDLIVIFVLLLLPLASQNSTSAWVMMSWWEVAEFAARLVAFGGILVLGTRYFVPIFLDMVNQTRSHEVFFFAVIFLCASIALLMQKLGLSLSVGAFCAGVMVSESRYGRQTVSDFTPLRNNFLGIFFVAIGMLLNLEFVKTHAMVVAGVLTAVVILKALIIMALMWALGNPGTLAVATGLILAQVGEFSFILLDQGVKLGLIDKEGHQLILAVAIGSLALTPLLYKFALTAAFRLHYENVIPKHLQNLALQLRESIVRDPMQVRVHETSLKLSTQEEIENHTILIGFGIAAQNLAKSFKTLDLNYRILETNHKTVKKYADKEPIIFGDATQEEILRAVHVETARLVVIAVTGAEITGSIHRAVRQISGKVPVIIRTQYLRDLRHLDEHPNTQLVIAEFEGTLELLSRALISYGVGEASIQRFLDDARARLEEEHRRSTRFAPPQ